MAGSTFGKILTVTTFGESHGPAIGAVVDGFPAGLSLCEEDIQQFLDRRKPGQSSITTARKEADLVEILSGVFEGKTTGTSIGLLIRNTSQRSADYSEIMDIYRPGHADYGFDTKYGFRDYRGGGRSSGRETAARVAAGAIAEKFLREMGIDVYAFARKIGPVEIDDANFDRDLILKNSTAMPDAAAHEAALSYLEKCREEKDSCGGMIEIRVKGMPSGVGDPVFDKLDARLAGALMSIGAVKSVEIGDGISVAGARGSENNDAFAVCDGKVVKKTNHSGGILGGMSDGSEIVIRLGVKPTPSIFSEQETIDIHGNERTIAIKGRHDPIVVPRAVVVAETMTSLVLLDAMLCQMVSRTSSVKAFYEAEMNREFK